MKATWVLSHQTLQTFYSFVMQQHTKAIYTIARFQHRGNGSDNGDEINYTMNRTIDYKWTQPNKCDVNSCIIMWTVLHHTQHTVHLFFLKNCSSNAMIWTSYMCHFKLCLCLYKGFSNPIKSFTVYFIHFIGINTWNDVNRLFSVIKLLLP